MNMLGRVMRIAAVSGVRQHRARRTLRAELDRVAKDHTRQVIDTPYGEIELLRDPERGN